MEKFQVYWKKNRHDRGEKVTTSWLEAVEIVEEKLTLGYKVWVNSKRIDPKNPFNF